MKEVAAPQSNTVFSEAGPRHSSNDTSLESSQECPVGGSSQPEPSGEGEECVNTQTGSVEVAAPQSNTVFPQAGPRRPSSDVNLESSPSVEFVISSMRRRGNRLER